MVIPLVVSVKVLRILRRNNRKIRELQKELANKKHGRAFRFRYGRALILN